MLSRPTAICIFYFIYVFSHVNTCFENKWWINMMIIMIVIILTMMVIIIKIMNANGDNKIIKVTPYVIGWAQPQNYPWCINIKSKHNLHQLKPSLPLQHRATCQLDSFYRYSCKEEMALVNSYYPRHAPQVVSRFGRHYHQNHCWLYTPIPKGSALWNSIHRKLILWLA